MKWHWNPFAQLPSSHSLYYIYVIEIAWRAFISSTTFYHKNVQTFIKIERIWRIHTHLPPGFYNYLLSMLALLHMYLYIHPSIHPSIYLLCLMHLKRNCRHWCILRLNISACIPLIGVQHCFQLFFLLINLNIIKCTKFKFTSQCVLTNANICAIPMPIKIQNIIVTQNVSSWSIPTPPHRKSLWFFFYHRSFYLPFEYVFTV